MIQWRCPSMRTRPRLMQMNGFSFRLLPWTSICRPLRVISVFLMQCFCYPFQPLELIVIALQERYMSPSGS